MKGIGSKVWKILLYSVGGGVVLCGLALLSLPWWLPRLIKPLAAQVGFHAASIRSDGFAAIDIENWYWQAEADNAPRVEGDQLRLPSIAPLLRSGLRDFSDLRIAARTVTVKLAAGRSAADPAAALDWPTLHAKALEGMAALEAHWPTLPQLSIERLHIGGADGSEHLRARSIALRNDGLSAIISFNGLRAPLQLTVAPPQANALQLQLAGQAPEPLSLRLSAAFSAEALRFSGALARPQLHPQWPESLDATLEGALRGGALHIDALHAQLPWLSADLTAPLRIELATLQSAEPAHLRLHLDLSRQALLDAAGQLSASLTVAPESLTAPSLTGSLSANNLRWRSFAIAGINARFAIRDRVLNLSAARVDLTEDSRIEAHGRFDFTSQHLTTDAAFHLTTAWLAAHGINMPIEAPLVGNARIDGPLQNPNLNFTLQPTPLQIPNLHAFTVALTLRGPARGPWQLATTATAPHGPLLTLSLQASPPANAAPQPRWELSVQSAELATDADRAPLVLTAPATLSFNPSEPLASLRSTPIVLRDADGALIECAADIPAQRLQARIANFALARLSSIVRTPLPPVHIDALHADFTEFAPAALGTFSIALHGTAPNTADLQLSGSGNFTTDGMELAEVFAAIAGQPWLQGDILLPISLFMQSTGGIGLTLLPEVPMRGDFTATLDPQLLAPYTDTPLLRALPEGDFAVSVAGSLAAPTAQIAANFAQLPPLEHLHPHLAGLRLRNVNLTASIDPSALTLDTLSAELEGCEFAFSGHLPMDAVRHWLAHRADLSPLRQYSDLSLEVRNWSAQRFGRWLPGYLRPTGKANAALRFFNGHLHGAVNLLNFSIRPTLLSATVDRLSTVISIADSRATLNEATARIGESELGLRGFVDFRTPRTPLFSLRINAGDVTLLRTSDLRLNADLDLLLERQLPSEPTRLIGAIGLRNSLVVMDFDPLAARTAGGAAATPPFFSVEAAPFADWLLDIGIYGEEALRFRSQYLNATLSADLQLQGTLRYPVWLGSLTTDDGTIAFPGSQLRIAQGEAFLTRAAQDAIQLDFNAIGQTASHVISLRVRGTTENPEIELAATPELENARILQLLATGSLSRAGFSSLGLYLGRSLIAPSASSNSLLSRLVLEVGRDVTESGRNTIDVFFEMSERFQLHGQYDKYDAHNLDLEWEVFSR